MNSPEERRPGFLKGLVLSLVAMPLGFGAMALITYLLPSNLGEEGRSLGLSLLEFLVVGVVGVIVWLVGIMYIVPWVFSWIPFLKRLVDDR
ncbi:MAG: hypothetical protein V3U90_00520 [Dehalococcoidia bacterium]